jgi:ABC-2 type transport system permease protein
MMKAFRTMLKVEFKLSLRGMDMFIFAICFPVVMIIILGIVCGSKPAFDGAQYTFLEQSFGAISTIAICAGGVMGLPLLISDYRHKKILKRFKVTPSSPALILTVHLLIYAIYSILSLILVYLAAKLFFQFNFNGSLPAFLGSYLLVMLSLFSIGMMVGGVAPDMKTASIIASILYFPMLIFSGATLPYEVMLSARWPCRQTFLPAAQVWVTAHDRPGGWNHVPRVCNQASLPPPARRGIQSPFRGH